jgi:hypothetical protein
MITPYTGINIALFLAKYLYKLGDFCSKSKAQRYGK